MKRTPCRLKASRQCRENQRRSCQCQQGRRHQKCLSQNHLCKSSSFFVAVIIAAMCSPLTLSSARLSGGSTLEGDVVDISDENGRAATEWVHEHGVASFTSQLSEQRLENRHGDTEETFSNIHQISLNSNSSLENRGGEPTLPPKRCDMWNPSLVPPSQSRLSSGSNHFNGLRYLDLPSAADETHPKKLLGHTMYKQWQFPPIHFDTYDQRSSSHGKKLAGASSNIGLSTPITNKFGQLSGTYRSILDYGGKHPFEGAAVVPETYKPLRIKFKTVGISMAHNATDINGVDWDENKVNVIRNHILPSISQIWSQALSVVPVSGNLFLSANTGINSAEDGGGKCGEALVSKADVYNGVPDADIVIYVTVDGPYCYKGVQKKGISSYGEVCSFDQHMRPIAGNLNICLIDIQTTYDGSITKKEILRQISAQTMEVGKILGLSPTLFQYYRDTNGKPWGSSSKTVTCVDGTKDTLDVPNILVQGFEEDTKNPFFEIASPTVKQIVRNQFDCQTAINGARLDNNPKSYSCFGETLDERYHFGEDMAHTVNGRDASMAFALSPLTLGLLEDSSWYRADFSKSTVPPFGRGAGCGFVKGKCVVDGNVPEYSKGFFCNEPSASGCDFTHSHKAKCDMDPRNFSLLQGGQGLDIQKQCPMKTKSLVLCSDDTNSPSFPWETYGKNSRCFETVDSGAVCMQSHCNIAESRLDLIVNDNVLQCNYDGQVLALQDGHQVKCPRLALVCPDLVCPANCSGKGVCDFCLEEPRCICDDPFDSSPGCWDS